MDRPFNGRVVPVSVFAYLTPCCGRQWLQADAADLVKSQVR